MQFHVFFFLFFISSEEGALKLKFSFMEKHDFITKLQNFLGFKFRFY